MKRLWLLSILSLAPSVSGCGCTLELRKELSPTVVALTVGETARPPQASIYACGLPRQPVVFEAGTFSSEDPAIASVDPETGVIMGVAPGETVILARGVVEQEQFSDIFIIPVTVEAPTTAR